MEKGSDPLTQHQARHLWATCEYIARQLTNLEAIVATSAVAPPFARYLDDLTPEQKRRLVDDCAAMRGEMARVLANLGIASSASLVSSRHSMRAGLQLIDVAVEELKPGHMKHYGPVSAGTGPELNGLVLELQAAVRRLAQTFDDIGETKAAADATEPPEPAATRAISRADADAMEATFRQTAGLFEDVRAVVEQLRDSADAIVFEALEHAADRASRLLDAEAHDATRVDAAVRDGVTEVGVERAEDVRRALANLVAKVQGALQGASASLGLPDSTAPAAWAPLMRAMPAFAPPVMHADLKLFLRRALGAGIAHARARRAVESQLGTVIRDLMIAQSGELYAWATRLLTRVREDFSSETDRYRRAAARLT